MRTKVSIFLFGLTILYLAIIFPKSVFANYDFALGVSETIYVKPGEIINLPARFKNTGSEPIPFRTYWYTEDSKTFINQFHDKIILPGEYLDFTFGSIHVSDTAIIGSQQDTFERLLGIGLMDFTTLESGHLASPPIGSLEPNRLSRIIISPQTYATPLVQYSTAKPAWFDNTHPDFGLAWIGRYGLSQFSFGSIQLGPDPNGKTPIITPEPPALILFTVGTVLIIAFRRKKSYNL